MNPKEERTTSQIQKPKGLLSRCSFLAGVGPGAAGLWATQTIFYQKLVHDPDIIPPLYEHRVNSYWLAGPYSPNPPSKGKIYADVTIVGGGVCGISAAYHIKKAFPDKKVVLLEGAVLGFGASGRNIGNLNPHGWENVGNPHPNGYSVLESLIQGHSISCDYGKSGCFILASNQKQEEKLEKFYHEKGGIYNGLKLLDKATLTKNLGTEKYTSALFDPFWGTVNPVKYLRGMKKILESLGVKIYERSRVISIRPGQKIELQTENGSVQSDKVVLATGSFSSKLGFFKNRIVPFHTGVIVTEPLTSNQLEAIGFKENRTFVDMDTLFGTFHLTSDNRIILGGKNSKYFYNDGLNLNGSYEPFYRTLTHYLLKIFPQLNNIHIDYQWSGFEGAARDRTPSFGQLESHPNLFYIYSNGLSVGTTMGKALAGYMEGVKLDDSLKPFLNRKLPLYPPEPLKYLLLNGALWYFRRSQGVT